MFALKQVQWISNFCHMQHDTSQYLESYGRQHRFSANGDETACGQALLMGKGRNSLAF